MREWSLQKDPPLTYDGTFISQCDLSILSFKKKGSDPRAIKELLTGSMSIKIMLNICDGVCCNSFFGNDSR